MIKIKFIENSNIGEYNLIEKDVPTLSDLVKYVKDFFDSKNQIKKIKINGELIN